MKEALDDLRPMFARAYSDFDSELVEFDGEDGGSEADAHAG